MARQDERIEAFEQELLEAWRLLQRYPDRERGFQLAGQRSAWPQVVRDVFEAYGGEAEAPRRPGLSRGEVDLVEAMFIAEGCLAMRITEGHRALVATVLTLKAWPERRGFRWDRAWSALGGRRLGATQDAVRKRYEYWLDVLDKAWAFRNGAGSGGGKARLAAFRAVDCQGVE